MIGMLNLKLPQLKKVASFFFLVAIVSISNAQVGIGTATPDASAGLEIDFNDKGLLPPRLTMEQRDEIENPAEGLTIYNTDKKCIQFFDSQSWVSTCDGLADEPSFTSVTGKIWMNKNLGASQVAEAFNDSLSFGDLYQWGRASDGHQSRTSQYYNDEIFGQGVSNFNNDPNSAWYGKFITNVITNNWVNPSVIGVNDLWQGVNGINNPCPVGYRVPTKAEWETELTYWSPKNRLGAFNSDLKLPAAGRRSGTNTSANIVNAGLVGVYCSSTLWTDDEYVFGMLYGSNGAEVGVNFKTNGCSVRCIKN